MSATVDSNRLYSAEDLYGMGDDARYELVRGELRVMEPAAPWHGSVTMRLSAAIANHAYAHALGEVFAAETGFVLRRNPDTVRAPDIAFVRADRLPAGGYGPGFAEGTPDLAVEVRSPAETVPQLWHKVDDYLATGAQAVWVVDPDRRTVAVHEPGKPVRLFSGGDTLDGGAVLAGFGCPVASLFVGVRRT